MRPATSSGVPGRPTGVCRPASSSSGGRVRRRPRRRHERAGDGRDHHDPTVAALHHRRERCLRRVEGGLEGDLQLALQLPGIELVEHGADRLAACLDHPGSVDENVDRPVRRLGGGDEVERLTPLGEICDTGGHGRTLAAQLGGAELDPVRRRRDRDPGAEAKEQARGGEADPGRAAAPGDERGPACEIEGAPYHHERATMLPLACRAGDSAEGAVTKPSAERAGRRPSPPERPRLRGIA